MTREEAEGLTNEADDECPTCRDGDAVPAKGYWRCPKCDAEWGEGDADFEEPQP